MQNTAKQNYSGLVTSNDTRPGNEVSWFYNTPEPKRGYRKWTTCNITSVKLSTATVKQSRYPVVAEAMNTVSSPEWSMSFVQLQTREAAETLGLPTVHSIS